MAKNAYGVGPASKEWGRKARKHETADRGLNHQADAAAIAEALAEAVEAGDPDLYWDRLDDDPAEYDDFWYDQD